MLVKIMKYHRNERVRMAAASVCSYRLPMNERQIEVTLRLDSEDDVIAINAIPPG